MNPFYNALTGSQNPMALLAQLRQNPLALLKRFGFNVPENINSPDAIIQHLMNSGQVTQEMYNKARQMSQSFRQ